MNRPRLTFQGSDVGLCRRTVEGKALVVYLDRDGQPTCHFVEVWPHELRGIGWHLAEVKARIAQLPLRRQAAAERITDAPPARPLAHDRFYTPND